ncbi:dihydrofolate reductase [Leifsonia sp. AK011]|uniref:dihydrofolate reductase family protein n=1 Tax=Leifsonia sp. AK011 TaxID=2723075 RepID=UPI0015C7C875|nr:dihydrofolate reductase family protein [Leifsonia sp. AK011]NYF11173.1 dihydrofolate reductase [Leifsonia sp. AK011]
MGRLVYTGLVSLDGYINDADGRFDWAEPSEEIHQFANDLDRTIGTHVYGRRLYETMVFWETVPPAEPVINDYAELWRDADKVVISTTLSEVASARTTLMRELSHEWLAQLKATATRDIGIGGPTLAAQVFDLIDDIHMLVYPVVVGGGGTRFLAEDAVGSFELASSRVFSNGVIHLHYRKDA